MKTYTVADLAQIFKVRKGYVYELIYTNKIKAIRLSERRFRITEEALQEFIQKQEEVGVI